MTVMEVALNSTVIMHASVSSYIHTLHAKLVTCRVYST